MHVINVNSIDRAMKHGL
jgi:hypothetical protein